MRALLVKMSSLGDLVHALPAVTAAQARGVRFDWVVEEAYQAIVERHPAVDRVIPIAWRRWRSAPWGFGGEMGAFLKALRSQEYDLLLDAQGLAKSAAVARLARGAEVVGFATRDVRERAAAWVYGRRVEVPRRQHAIDRQCQLFAGAFGYVWDADEAVDFGVSEADGPRELCLFLHGSTWDVQALAGADVDRSRPKGGDGGSRTPAALGQCVGAGASQAHCGRRRRPGFGRLGLVGLSCLLQRARLVIGVDSGLTHLAAALGAPTLALHGSTSHELTGCRGRHTRILASAFGCAPCQSRTCRYRGPGRTWRNEPVAPPCYAELAPDRVWAAALELMDAAGVLHILSTSLSVASKGTC